MGAGMPARREARGSLLAPWQRSTRELEAPLTTVLPTPPEALERPLGDAGRL